MRKSPIKHTVTRKTKSGKTVTYTRGEGTAPAKTVVASNTTEDELRKRNLARINSPEYKRMQEDLKRNTEEYNKKYQLGLTAAERAKRWKPFDDKVAKMKKEKETAEKEAAEAKKKRDYINKQNLDKRYKKAKGESAGSGEKSSKGVKGHPRTSSGKKHSFAKRFREAAKEIVQTAIETGSEPFKPEKRKR